MPSGDQLNPAAAGGAAPPPLLEVRELGVTFPVRTRGLLPRRIRLRALTGVTFHLGEGETLGLVGESGSGKTTLARAILQLIPRSSGELRWRGTDPASLKGAALRARRRDMQIVFQDPLAALDPRMTAGESIAEPLRSMRPRPGGREIADRVAAMMTRVGIAPAMRNRYPHEFSMGQCQRIGIARAMIAGPRLIVCDEPVSALDVSIQAQIVNLLMELQRAENLSLIFISHNLSVVRHVSRRIVVLHLGRIVEMADRDDLFRQPAHPYTEALIAAIPLPDPKLERARERPEIRGEPPSPIDPPSGCTYRTRCPKADALCAREEPPLRKLGGRLVACHYPNEGDPAE